MNLRSAVTKVNRKGMLLVFPVNNKKEPASLWSEFHPRKPMRWEWDESGDQGVADLWHLRERLSSSRKVIYTKWYRGRATLISLELFRAMLRVLRAQEANVANREAREILDLLGEDSPLSTKMLKKLSGLQGRSLERLYMRALKELWSRLLIVAFGEVDEGAFPSLAVGSTRVIFEELWRESLELSLEEATAAIDRYLPIGSLFRKYWDEVVRGGLVG